jgi:predicted glycogen debranching enzyme
MSSFTIDTFGQLEPFIRREWLLTNGLGGFAFGTVPGANTRRYHGLLIAATNPPVGRVSTLSRLGEMIILDGDTQHPHELATNQFRDNVHPNGYMYLRRFDLGDTARWLYEVNGVRISKEVQVPWLKNIVGVRYTIEADRSDRAIEFRVWPFFALRDFHALRRAAGYDMPTQVGPGAAITVSSDQISAHLAADVGEWINDPSWWYGHVYPVETDRGQDDSEDLYTPGRFTLKFTGSATMTIWASPGPLPGLDWEAEIATRRRVTTVPQKSASVTRLLRAANDFVVSRKTPDGNPGTSIIAGYPWFADWGRDTFISLPGLLLLPGRFEQAKQVLSVFAAYVSEGMIPNRFDDYTSEPSYNTVDASLWFIHSAFEYARQSKDSETFEKLLKLACRKIIDGYRRGTRFGIRMDESDGLITQGDEHTQLTWMDAKCNGVAFTPRQGKPVEINALWYHALVLMGETQLASKVRENFSKAFWISPFRGLADVVRGAARYERDNTIRPKKMIAASQPNSPFTNEQCSAVVEVVRRELLTPFGLRTLARSDPKYKSRYSGPQFVRDQAYHNGTIWPWLIGGFLDAYLRVHDGSTDAVAQAQRWLSPLIDAMDDGCLGQLPEIYEAEEPYRGVGACAQAWSVAEVLRLAVRLGM